MQKQVSRVVRFSIRSIFVFTLLIALLLAWLIFKSGVRADAVAKLRREGALIRVQNQPPWPLSLLQGVDWGPIFDFPFEVTIAAVVDHEGNVQIGNEHLSMESAKVRILQQLQLAKSCGAKRIEFNGCHDNGKYPDLDLQILRFAEQHFASTTSGHWYFYRRDWEQQEAAALATD